jgi:hemerythrin-like domain-containing protein
MPRKSASKTSSSDAIDILTEDHKHVMKMFADFEKLKQDEDNDEDAKQTLIERACTELTIHSQVEEEFFYPALRDALDDTDLVDQAEVEHGIANQLITELESMQPGDEFYEAKFTVLGEYVRHHIEEEQEKIFPKAKKVKLALSARRNCAPSLACRKRTTIPSTAMPRSSASGQAAAPARDP